MNIEASEAFTGKFKVASYMNDLIKRFSPTVELIIILIIGFGLFIYSSTCSFLLINSHLSSSWTYQFTSLGHYSIVIHETIALLIIMSILKVRDWKIEDFNLTFTFRMIWNALLIMFICNFIINMGFKLFMHFNVINDSTTKHVQYGMKADWLSMSLIVVINSFFEEFLLIGYLFKRLEKYHPVIIIGFSMILRMSYHTYQGWMGFMMILPLGLVYGLYYYKYRKLWPLIIAHGLFNLISFIRMPH